MKIDEIITLLKHILEKQEEITNSLDIILELLTEQIEEDSTIEAHYANGTPIKWDWSDGGVVEGTFTQNTYTTLNSDVKNSRNKDFKG